MSGKFNMADYVDVAERIAQFHQAYPDGSLQSTLERQQDGWLCRAMAYRTPDDPRPGVGHAFEPVPGKTPYTRDSEAMNAETSAWGRAIVALGFETKKIASANEVRARQNTPEPAPQDDRATSQQKQALIAITNKLKREGKITQEQLDRAAGGEFRPDALSKVDASGLIERLEKYAENVEVAA